MLSKINSTNAWPDGPFMREAAAARKEWFSYALAKRILDLTLGAILLIITTPIWIAAAIAIKLDSQGPVFFIQERVGQNGRGFRCFKFRTMEVNAEARLEEMRRRGEVAGTVYKIRHDPRVTRSGRMLRRASLDELPQLLNVLAGQMSLVGPRPVIPAHARGFSAEDQVRVRVKPGLTCLWALRGRSDSEPDVVLAADREYVRRRSLGLDLWILLQTPFVVLRGRGAY